MAMRQRHFNTWAASRFEIGSIATSPRERAKAERFKSRVNIYADAVARFTAVVAVLNLKRVANLGMPWLNAPLLVIGIAFMAMSARRR